MKKLKILIAINLILFASVVFLGIEQAGRGAEIAKLEDELELASVQKMNLSEGIFSKTSESKNQDIALKLGFSKPQEVYYFSVEKGFAKAPVR